MRTQDAVVPSPTRSPLEIALESDFTVLLTGPTGAGKSRLAEEIHTKSRRASARFVPVNLASLAEGTFESELFGHERGAFTGADRKRVGRVELAEKGTLFLDEIGELSLKQQARMLELLQNKRYAPVGASEERRGDFRVIAATHRDLQAEVRAGRFREDLFHRLRVVAIRLPSLAEQAVDFDRILHDCLESVMREQSKCVTRIDPAAAIALENYSWPGNYRELRHVLEFAVLASREGVLRVECLPRWFLESKELLGNGSALEDDARIQVAEELLITYGLEEALARIERKSITWALQRSRGGVSRAARQLKMSKTTFLRRLKTHGLRGAPEVCPAVKPLDSRVSVDIPRGFS